ncbi:hypothetical protein R3P38DRAFT_1515262 [Favolaschia claudopus]|uniref:Uncharacterized protein n=1 Tax=Favolaschia claudopus TaxID=2862362 RepID=A0AAW0AJ38_9AGAR
MQFSRLQDACGAHNWMKFRSKLFIVLIRRRRNTCYSLASIFLLSFIYLESSVCILGYSTAPVTTQLVARNTGRRNISVASWFLFCSPTSSVFTMVVSWQLLGAMCV